MGGDTMTKMSRSPQIMADAAYAILNKPSAQVTGNFFIDELLLRDEGVTDFSKYQNPKSTELAADFFIPAEVFEKSPTKLVHAY
jgi:citronellol/citronellal dehydrogenase